MAVWSQACLGRLLDRGGLSGGGESSVCGGETGDSAAVLADMWLDVTMMESDADLASRARALLGKSAQVVEGALEGGVKKHAPFDFILIDGAVEEIPQAIVRQLRDGGKLATVHIDAMGDRKSVV